MNYNHNFNVHGNYYYYQDDRNHDRNHHRRNGSNDYYEMVSDEEDVSLDEDDIGPMLGSNQNQLQANPSSAIDLDFDQLPFVPKFSSEIRNTVEAAKNSEKNDNLKAPLVGDWGPHCSKSNASTDNNSIQPVNCPYFPDHSEWPAKSVAQSESVTVVDNEVVRPENQVENSQTQSNESALTQSSSLTNTNLVSFNEPSKPIQQNEPVLPRPLTNLLSASASTCPAPAASEVVNENDHSNVKGSTGSNWADENGDPIQGAFDSIEDSGGAAADSCVNVVNNTKVEYVFHVKEKKNDSADCAGVSLNCDVESASASVLNVSSGCGDGGGILQGTVISSLVNLAPSGNLDSAPLPAQTLNFVDIQDNTGFSDKISDEYDQKTLYESSRNKQELSNLHQQVQNEILASTSASALAISGGIQDVFPKKKMEMFPFKRKNFINQNRPGELFVGDVTIENEAVKTTADKALENQALNELLREVKQGAERARNYGALGWQKQPIPVVNKRFLKNTLVSTLRQPYKPPRGGGRFHKGLNDSRPNKDHYDYSDSSSSSSRSSRSSSRSSGSYSRSSSSRSHSSSSSSRSRSRSRRHKKGKQGPGPWPGDGGPHPPPNAYYDWAAYGYPWYDPAAAAAMYYGMEGGGGYPQMYSNDPQFWAAYRDFYGIGGRGARGGGYRGGGRGFDPTRGRGGFVRGRGRGGMLESDERWRERERFGDEEFGSFSRSRSRSWSGSPTGSRRKRSGRSNSLDNNSRVSDSSRGKRKNRSSERKSVDDNSENRKRHKSGSSKSSDAKLGDDKEKSSKSSSKNGKKKRSESKQKDCDPGKKDGEDNDEKDSDRKKKKKHKKGKKHKKSKKDEKGDNGDEEKKLSLCENIAIDGGEGSDKRAEENTPVGKEKITKESADGTAKSESKSCEGKKEKAGKAAKSKSKEGGKGKVTKKKGKKSDVKKKDGVKKVKKKMKGKVDEGENSSNSVKKDENVISENSVDVKADEGGSASVADVKSGNDNAKPSAGEGPDKKVKEKDRGEPENTSVEKMDRSERDDDTVGDPSRKRLRNYDDEVLHDKTDSDKLDLNFRDSDSDRYQHGCRDKYSRADTSYKYSDRYQDDHKDNYKNSDRYHHDRIEKYRRESDERNGVRHRHSSKISSTHADSERSRNRGGKIEEIERRLQARKAMQRNKSDDITEKIRQENNINPEGAEDEKVVRSADMPVKQNKDGKCEQKNGNEHEKDSSQRIEKSEDAKDSEQSRSISTEEGKPKKKKAVKKKLKKKFKTQGSEKEVGSKEIVPGATSNEAAESGQIVKANDGAVSVPKKKKKVLKRKSETSGDGDIKTKKKKKKVTQSKSSSETVCESQQAVVLTQVVTSDATLIELNNDSNSYKQTGNDDNESETKLQ